MFPHTPDQVLGLGMATVVALAVANAGFRDRDMDEGTMAIGRRASSAAQVADTLRVGDRRCLTRRPDDCLAEPVPMDEPHRPSAPSATTCGTARRRPTPCGPARAANATRGRRR